MPDYDYSYITSEPSIGLSASSVWTIIALVLAIGGGIVLYFTVFSKANKDKYKGFMAKVYELVHFKYFVINDLFKICYLVAAIALTLLSFNLISVSFLSFILVLVLGNIGLRLSFELIMLFLELCDNVREINKKIK